VAVFKFRNLKNGQAVAVPPGEFIIGRADDAYVHLEDSSVSRHHAHLINNERGFFVEDLGSVNGTTVRGAYLSGLTKVSFGDLVHIGAISFRVDPETGGEPAVSPEAGLRSSDKSYVRKPTERISIQLPMAPGEPELPSGTPRDLVRKSVPLPTLARLIATPEPAKSTSPTRQHQQSEDPRESESAAQIEAEDAREVAEKPKTAKIWFVVIFLAGLGIGLVAGLLFAKVFLDMGGKAAGLP
jgi:pSer/pThr/pTyr-binding forkhead associated (FHA) protein